MSSASTVFSASSTSSASCGSCKRSSENSEWDCPPRMADGRLFTDYRPRCVVNLQYAKPMTGSQDYRQFLIQNGSQIMDQNRAAASKVAFCAPCVKPWNQGTMAPEADRVVCDKVSCSRVPVPTVPGAQPGLAFGTGREYGGTGTPSLGADERGFVLAQEAAQAAAQAPGVGNCCDARPGGAYGASYPGVALAPPGPARWAVPGGGAVMGGGDPTIASA